MDSSALREAALAPGKLAAAVAENAQAVGDARAGVARAIGENAGGLFSDVGMKIQANRVARQVFEADLTMRKTTDDFRAQLAKMPDEGTWLPSYQQLTKDVRSTILANTHVGPDARQILTQKMDMWEAATTSEIRTAALLKGTAKTREAAIADANYAAQQGDLDGAMKTLNAAVASYAMSPEDVKKISARFPTIAAQAKADIAMAQDPIHAPEMIKQFEKQMEPRIYLSVMAHARENMHAAQSDNLNSILEQMRNSPDGTTDPEMLKRMVAAGSITQRMADGVISQMEREKRIDDRARAKELDEELRGQRDLLREDAQSHDFGTDKTPEETAKKMKEEAVNTLPEKYRVQVFNAIDHELRQAKEKKEREEHPVETLMLARLRSDPLAPQAALIKEVTAKVGTSYLLPDSEVARRFPGQAREDVVRRAQYEESGMAQRFREWFRQHAKDNNGTGPSEMEAEIARQQIVASPHIAQALNQVISAPTNISQEDLQQMQNNLFNGKPWYEQSSAAVKVRRKSDGATGTIPASQLNAALKGGYELDR